MIRAKQAYGYFNPRSSCEERHAAGGNINDVWQISIHAPHARSDDGLNLVKIGDVAFQSTLLMRGATTSAQKVGASQ